MTATRMTRTQMAGRRLKLLRKVRGELGSSPDLERSIAAAIAALADATVLELPKPAPALLRRRVVIPTGLAASLVVLVALGALTTDTEARRHPTTICVPDDRFACSGASEATVQATAEVRRKAPRRHQRRWTAPRAIAKAPTAKTIVGYQKEVGKKIAKAVRRGRSVSLAGVHPVLVAKAKELIEKCGSVIISAKHGRRNRSLHPLGRAIDAAGNPKCIVTVMRGWKGGMSTDYWRVTRLGVPAHYHISWGGWEHGTRFAHRIPGTTRFAWRR